MRCWSFCLLLLFNFVLAATVGFAGFALLASVRGSPTSFSRSAQSSFPAGTQASGSAQEATSGAGAVQANPEVDTRPGIHVAVTSSGTPYMVRHLRCVTWPRFVGAACVCLANRPPTLGTLALQNFQTRIMWHSLQKHMRQRNPASDLTHFTRILHRTTLDELAGEVPTFRAEPLQPKCDRWCKYAVSDRPNAVRQWLNSPGAVREEVILLGETDYIFLKPITLPPPDHPRGVQLPLVHQFSYMHIHKREWQDVLLAYLPGMSREALKQAWDSGGLRTGPAPCLMEREDLATVVPMWEATTEQFMKDEAVEREFGWVREMFAFSLASLRVGLKYQYGGMQNRMDLDLADHAASASASASAAVAAERTAPFITQPPADRRVNEAPIIHYTYGCLLKNQTTGKIVWRWEKRDFAGGGFDWTKPYPMPPASIEGLECIGGCSGVVRDAARTA